MLLPGGEALSLCRGQQEAPQAGAASGIFTPRLVASHCSHLAPVAQTGLGYPSARFQGLQAENHFLHLVASFPNPSSASSPHPEPPNSQTPVNGSFLCVSCGVMHISLTFLLLLLLHA